MQIVYTGTAVDVEIRDILDPRFNRWHSGEVRDVPDDAVVSALAYGEDQEETTTQRNAVEAILNCGPAFVDAATRKNPLHVCVTCEAFTLAHGFRPGDDYIEYATDEGDPQCPACFLAAHPEYIAHHRDLGARRALFTAIEERRAAAQAPTPPASPATSAVTPPEVARKPVEPSPAPRPGAALAVTSPTDVPASTESTTSTAATAAQER